MDNKEYCKKYHIEHRDEICARKKAHRLANHEKYIEREAKYRDQNKDKIQ